MKKALPLLAGAIVVPLLAATVAAFAASAGGVETPGVNLPSSSVSVDATTEQEIPATTVTTITPPAVRTTLPHRPADPAPVAVAADPDPSTTTPELPTTPVPPNEWPTPAPTTPADTSPIPSGGPVDMAVSWDGLKCARSDAWILQTDSGAKMMCPGSRNP